MQQAKQCITVKRLRTIRRADCRVMQFAELFCHVLRDAVVFHIPLHRAPTFILQPDTGHIKDNHILLYEHNAFTSHLMLDSDEVYQMTKRGLDAAQIAAAKGIHLNLVLVKLLELHHLGYDLRHYHAQHHAFIKHLRLPAYFRFDTPQIV